MTSEFSDKKLAVVVPNYPSANDMYLCAFIHSRVKAYMQAGINVDVLWVWDDCIDYEQYEVEGVSVTKMVPATLERHLAENDYSACFLHFFDLRYEQVVTSPRLSGVKFFLWAHNPETRYWDWPLFVTPYFSKPPELTPAQIEEFEERDWTIKALNKQENVAWVFVSEALKTRSEELIGITFKRAYVIPNLVDETVFADSKRKGKIRRSVVVVRPFKNCDTYAIDIDVAAIVELSKRRCFRHMTFDIYGSGPMFDILTEPVKRFENVHLHETFLTQEQLKEVFATRGIALFATRFDSQGVAMCEAAMAGMPVVSSDIDAANYFLPNDRGLLCEVENPVAYADAIEKLVKNPFYYSDCAAACRKKVFDRCSRAMTVEKEIDLFRLAVKEAQ